MLLRPVAEMPLPQRCAGFLFGYIPLGFFLQAVGCFLYNLLFGERRHLGLFFSVATLWLGIAMVSLIMTLSLLVIAPMGTIAWSCHLFERSVQKPVYR